MTRRRHYLVYHSNPLVSEDLRETLEATGACVVEVLSSLAGAVRRCYDLAFVEVAPDQLEAKPEWSWLMETSKGIVALTSGLNDTGPVPGKIVLMPQPFRSDDVLDILTRAGIIIPDAD